MGKQKKGKNGRKKNAGGNRGGGSVGDGVHNFLLEAGPGCHICHYDAPWVFGSEPFDRDDYEEDAHIPDIALSDGMVTVINTERRPRTVYLTLQHRCLGADGRPLQMGWTRDEEGNVSEVITFILVVSPQTMLYVCQLEDMEVDLEEVNAKMDSDVQELQLHPSPEPFDERHVYPFPLGGEGPFLCTQGINGGLTHFFAGSHHAVDFRCPVGTPLLALGDGEVVDVRQGNTVSGVHVRNLFLWNSIMLALDDGTFVEYVHIRDGSVTVKLGDRVAKGQVVCESGDVGFSPEPHLHMQMHLCRDVDAPTLKFALQGADGAPYFPEAGKAYDVRGVSEAPPVAA